MFSACNWTQDEAVSDIIASQKPDDINQKFDWLLVVGAFGFAASWPCAVKPV